MAAKETKYQYYTDTNKIIISYLHDGHFEYNILNFLGTYCWIARRFLVHDPMLERLS